MTHPYQTLLSGDPPDPPESPEGALLCRMYGRILDADLSGKPLQKINLWGIYRLSGGGGVASVGRRQEIMTSQSGNFHVDLPRGGIFGWSVDGMRTVKYFVVPDLQVAEFFGYADPYPLECFWASVDPEILADRHLDDLSGEFTDLGLSTPYVEPMTVAVLSRWSDGSVRRVLRAGLQSEDYDIGNNGVVAFASVSGVGSLSSPDMEEVLSDFYALLPWSPAEIIPQTPGMEWLTLSSLSVT